MRLLSFLKRSSDTDTAPPKAPSADEVQRARTRARRRLIGAVVLLGVGIIGFPLVFETQPRPIPVDLPIDIPRKDGAPPLSLPPPNTPPQASGSVTSETPDTGNDATSTPPQLAERPETAEKPAAEKSARPEKPAASDKPVASPKPPTGKAPTGKSPVAEQRESPKAPASPSDAARARALLDGKEAADPGRFVVQVGAFSDEALARATRSKIEKLGLKAYTQVVDTGSGKRIRVRVGPFDSRDEADKAAGKIKSAGLSSAILAL